MLHRCETLLFNTTHHRLRTHEVSVSIAIIVSDIKGTETFYECLLDNFGSHCISGL